MPDLRPNLQVRQPTNQGDDVNDGNGWPTPLTDPSSPLKMAVTNGSNGEQRNFDPISTSMQDQISKPEGSGGAASPNTATDNGGGKGSFTQTSQQKRGELSLPGQDKVQVQ